MITFDNSTPNSNNQHQAEHTAAGQFLPTNNDIFKLLVNSVADYAIFFIDKDGFVQSWNVGAKNIKWYSAEEVIGKHISIFYTNEDVQAGIPAVNLQNTIAKGHFTAEGWRKRKDSSLFWASVNITPLYNSKNKLLGFAKVTRDITPQKIAETKIKYLAQLIDKTSDAIFSLSSDYHILSWNKAAQLMYGYEPEEVLLKTVDSVLQAGVTSEYRFETRKKLIEQGFWAGEIRHRKKDGSFFWVFLSVTLSKDAKGNVDEYICICRDITEQKKLEEERKEIAEKIERLAQQRLEESLKEIDDYKYALNRSSIVAITDAKGIITYVNDNFCNISQYTADELVGKTHRIVNSGYHPKEFIKNLWQTIREGKVWKGEIRNRRKDGSYYWVDTTIVPFVNKDGEPYQYLAIRADISGRKVAENELKLLNEELEQRVLNRTQQLEAVNKELEAFSYSVSHDLRAPLRAVSGYAKILQEDYEKTLDEEGKRLLNRIISNAAMMGQLIDDLLKFSRLGRKELTLAYINMQQLVQNCLAEVLASTEIIYNVQVQQLPGCMGDEAMLKQVWLNLISNAVKYSSKKSAPAILIGCRLESSQIIYYIRDNGVGFDMQYAHKLFNIFQRLHRSDEFEGTGVGLALIKKIVYKHYGEVWAEAEPGKGAAFYFTIPLKIIV